mgnify:CR=1 FL=1
MACKRKDMRKWEDGLGTVHHVSSCLDVACPECSLNLKGTLGCAGKKMTMKKLMITATAALCATVGFSAITSANVVGYATDTLAQNKFVIKAIQFEDVASGKVDANTVLSGFTGVDFDENSAFRLTAPQIQVQSTAGYNTYYYLNDAYIEATDSTLQGWADGAGNYVDLELTPGTAVWVKVPGGDTAATMSGAVSAAKDVPVEIPAGKFTLVGNGYPAPVTLNGRQMTSGDIMGVDFDENSAFRLTAPQIQVQSTAGYNTYYYLNDAYIEATDSTKQGWADGAGNYVEPTVAVGAGFWVKSNDKMNIAFNP